MSKKVLVIPDVHGTTIWKACLDKVNEFDYIVQLGDWFDSWNNNWSEVDQIENLRDFIKFKKKYTDKVHALIGNHDLGYLMHEDMSGHQKNKEVDIREAMIEFAPYMDIACKIDKYVYSHAGFSKTWMKNNHYKTIEEVNAAFHDSCYEPFRFNGMILNGDDVTQGPTWIRPRALCTDLFFKYQVVGHTEFEGGSVKLYNKNGEVYVIDTPEHECLFKIGDSAKRLIKAPMYNVYDRVEFIANKNEHKIGVIIGCNYSPTDNGETDYDIELYNHEFWKNCLESCIVKKI